VKVSLRVARASVLACAVGVVAVVGACDSSPPTFSGPVVKTVELSPRTLTLHSGVLDSTVVDTMLTFPDSADSTVTDTVDTTLVTYDSTLGDAGQITAVLKDENGNPVDTTIVPPQQTTGWTTSDTLVARPDVNGNVQAMFTPGTATIYGSVATAIDSVAVTVTPPTAAVLQKAAAKRAARLARHKAVLRR